MELLFQAARRLDNVQFSPVRKVLERANQLAQEGRKIVHLEVGEPDFNTPSDIVDGTVRSLKERNRTHYAPNRGTLQLRNSVSQLLKQEYGVAFDGASEILLTVGVAEAIFDVIFGLVDAGDEVVILTPAYMNYENCIHIAGATCIKVELREDTGYQVEAEALKAAISEKTRMIVVTNPNNPTGTTLNQKSLQIVAEVARQHGIVILADEIYSSLTYGVEFISFASLPGMREHTIVVNGFSKCFAMTGWRVGYIACDKRYIPQILKVHQYVTTCIPTFIQDGLVEGMLTEHTQSQVRDMVASFDQRREAVLAYLKQVPGVRCNGADGAFYIFANVKETGLTGEEFAARLLEEYGVAVVPGIAFGENSVFNIRISYGTKLETLMEGLGLLHEFAKSLQR